MSLFQLTLTDLNNKNYIIYYENEKNKLYDEKMKEYRYESRIRSLINKIKHPNRSAPYEVRVYCGKGCNFSCAYCLQRNEKDDVENRLDKREIVSEIIRVIGNKPITPIQLWGGEPFYYFESMKEYVRLFKELAPNRDFRFTTSTNGSLLGDLNIRKFLMEDIAHLQISWDGDGQFLRNAKDPLDDPMVMATIKEYLGKGKFPPISFAPTITKYNNDLEKYVSMVKERIGTDKFLLASARLLIPFDDKAAQFAMTDEQLNTYCKDLQRILINKTIPQWLFPEKIILAFMASIGSVINMGYCPGKRGEVLIVDEGGNMLLCANSGSTSIDENGQPYSIESIKDIPKHGKHTLGEFKRLDERKKTMCNKCILYSMCRGGCPRISNNQEELHCKLRYIEQFPVFACAIFKFTNKFITNIKIED